MDAEWETDPTVNYRVIFWIGETSASEHDLLDAEDVHAAIAWADAEAQSRSCTYVSTPRFAAANARASSGSRG
jgi:hypothetical protein